MSRSDRIKKVKSNIATVAKVKPGKPGRPKRSEVLNLKNNDVIEYKEEFGLLLIEMGSKGYQWTSAPAFIYKKTNKMISMTTIHQWRNEIPHFSMCYEIFAGAREMWMQEIMLSPPKIRLLAGPMKKEVIKGKERWVPNMDEAVFKEEQIKNKFFNHAGNLEQAKSSELLDHGSPKEKIIDISPTKKNKEIWEQKYLVSDQKTKTDLMRKVLEKLSGDEQ